MAALATGPNKKTGRPRGVTTSAPGNREWTGAKGKARNGVVGNPENGGPGRTEPDEDTPPSYGVDGRQPISVVVGWNKRDGDASDRVPRLTEKAALDSQVPTARGVVPQEALRCTRRAMALGLCVGVGSLGG